MITKRIFMAEADAATGGNSAPAVAADASADVPQAQGAPVITKEIADLIGSTVAKAVSDVRDSIFAEARRTFTEKRTKPAEPTSAPAQQAQTPQLDPLKLRALDRTLTKMGLADKISDSQYQRVEKMFAMESPEDVESWAKDFFQGYGVAQQTATPAPQPAAPAVVKPTNERPASDRGAPQAPKVPLEEASLRGMSPDDVKSLISKVGLPKYREMLFRELRGQTVQITKP